jgi:CBS domain-containing protein
VEFWWFLMESNVLVRDIMSKNVKVVREDTNLHEVIATIGKFEINSLIVVQAERPIGIITTRDALVRGFEHGLPASQITAGMVASSPVITIDEQATVQEAAEKMRRSKIKHLPVISGDKLVGIVTDSDIMFAVPSMLSMMEEVCRQPQK